MKKLIITIIISLGVVYLFLSRSFGNFDLKIATHPWIGYESLYLAEQFSWLPSGVSIFYVNSARDSLQLLKERKVDAATLTLDEVVGLLSEGIAVEIILIMDISLGADAILYPQRPSAVLNLKNKRIAVERKALGEFFLNEFLEKHGASISEVVLVDSPPPKHPDLAARGEIDLVVTYEPYVSILQERGWFKVFDTSQIPDTVFDVLVIRKDLNFQQKLLVAEVVEAHFRALEHIRINRSDAIFRIAAHHRVDSQYIHNALNGVYLPSSVANHFYLNDRKLLWQVMQKVAKTLDIAKENLPQKAELVMHGRFLPSYE
ncbi:MAG: ABC transporter substrate-binding protein [Leptospiraceae bacterium]|nr:ABC transporter substrate-binding protein [Leptospiraceae bacterium]MDW8307355.1 ABC transporter substrate-binding protein [Leptospiraceae bacterium]